LRKNILDFTFIINGAPQICSLAAHADKHFFKMPGSGRLNTARSDGRGDRRTKFQNPSADRFIADINASFGKQILKGKRKQSQTAVELLTVEIGGVRKIFCSFKHNYRSLNRSLSSRDF